MTINTTLLKAFRPAILDSEKKLWGFSLTLSNLVSTRNWGVGDFSDLQNLLKWASARGAALLNLQPLHEPLPNDDGSTEYTSARFIDPIYIDVESVLDFRESNEIQRKYFSPTHRERLEGWRQAEVIDFVSIRKAKHEALLECFQHFREAHLISFTHRGQEFREFQKSEGEPLHLYALFKSIEHHLQANKNEPIRFQEWPEQFKDKNSQSVRDFESANQERLEFFQYLQWQADQQLRELGEYCLRVQFALGLGMTITDAISKEGADSWAGYPPPLSPNASPEVLARTMRYAGAVNVSAHGLQKLASSQKGLNGSRAELKHVLEMLARESHRGQCLVMIEESETEFNYDPQTEEDQPVSLCQFWNFLPILPFSQIKIEASDYAALDEIPEDCAVTFAKQMGPNFAQFWEGVDLETDSQELADKNRQTLNNLVEERVFNRISILRLLEEENLLPSGVTIDPASVPKATPELIAAVYSLIASSQAKLVLFQLEEAFPRRNATINGGADFARDLGRNENAGLIIDSLQRLRESNHGSQTRTETESKNESHLTLIPRATYRLQFNSQFTFSDAIKLVPYLARLGVSHVYASPLLKARPGSMHGYDITDHKCLNPEIGNLETFDDFVGVLKEHKMGLILDIVPNHMGIGPDNAWWMDVLENGPASIYSEYFDIDWEPVKHALYGKVLLPILGESYGQILRDGKITLEFEPENGHLFLRYFDHRLPLNPVSYPIVLGHRLEILKERMGIHCEAIDEYQSILSALERLPVHTEKIGFAERIREKRVQMQRLASLCDNNPEVVKFINQNITEIQAVADNIEAQERLHELLSMQPYRLCDWRVASDEINYRRFFDVNDLAAVRTEDARVWSEMHSFLMELIEARKIEGLRIDHPDGLYDPAGYFMTLQQEAAKRLDVRFETGPSENFHSSANLPFYVVVEKILAPFEHIQSNWLVQGTTGYDYLNTVLGLLIDTSNKEKFDEIYRRFTGLQTPYDQVRLKCKHLILDSVLASELNMLAHRLSQIAESSWYYRDFTLSSLRIALRQTVANFPIYRTYVGSTNADKKARHYIDWATRQAEKQSPGLNPNIFQFIRNVLTLDLLDTIATNLHGERRGLAEDVRTFAMKFQQFSGPVMAKSVEDTTFYRYNRFVCLNEVGGEPERFGITASAFHFQNLQRQQRRPFEMIATSTHDTKRAEDVRARLAVLSELPDLWEQKVTEWSQLNRSCKTNIEGDYAPDKNDEYFIYQTLVGALPLDSFAVDRTERLVQFKERIQQYALKAAREGKTYTSWIKLNPGYEQALTDFIEKILTPCATNNFLEDFLLFTSRISHFGLINSLTQTLMKMASPGVPDIYQGCELWDFSLVDPDNRRPVDFEARDSLLATLSVSEQATFEKSTDSSLQEKRASLLKEITADLSDGRAKLLITSTCLHLRENSPELFTKGSYIPIETENHIVAFAREYEGKWCVVAAPLLTAELQSKTDSKEQKIHLPKQLANKVLFNVLSQQEIQSKNGSINCQDLFTQFPVAVLTAIV